MSIVTKDDFVGEIKVPKTSFSELDNFILEFEEDILVELMGGELYSLFKADLTQTQPQIPQTDRFIKIFNPFIIDHQELVIVSKGIKRMLAQFIYFEFIRGTQYENSATGTMKTNTELGRHADGEGNEVMIYNKGVSNAHAIQWYIHENIEDYPEENMQLLEYTSGI